MKKTIIKIKNENKKMKIKTQHLSRQHKTIIKINM